jgi:hypothetical protein
MECFPIETTSYLSFTESEEQINPGFVLHVLGLIVLGIFVVEVDDHLVLQ